MTPAHAVELALSWLGLLAAVAAVMSPRLSRLSWGASGLCFSAWLALTESPAIAAALGSGVLAAVLLERGGDPARPDFTRVTRRLALLLAAIAAAVVLMVRVAEVDPTDAPYVFPVLATGVTSLVALFAAVEPAEIHRAARLLLVLAAVGWTLATTGSQAAPAVLAAAALLVLALVSRIEPPEHARPPGTEA